MFKKLKENTDKVLTTSLIGLWIVSIISVILLIIFSVYMENEKKTNAITLEETSVTTTETTSTTESETTTTTETTDTSTTSTTETTTTATTTTIEVITVPETTKKAVVNKQTETKPVVNKETTTVVTTTITTTEVQSNNTNSEETTTTISTTTTTENNNGMTYIGNFRLTGYVATGNPTASGVYPYVGGVAMNNSQRKELGIKYGDKIYIEGLGTYTVFDCGCRYNVVDVFCNTVSECYNITSYADVYIVN